MHMSVDLSFACQWSGPPCILGNNITMLSSWLLPGSVVGLALGMLVRVTGREVPLADFPAKCCPTTVHASRGTDPTLYVLPILPETAGLPVTVSNLGRGVGQ